MNDDTDRLTEREVTCDHRHWMSRALEFARIAESKGEVPVGAVLVRAGKIIGEGYNQPISANDPTAHAEIVAIRQAAEALGNYRLPGTTLYVTIEPCTMCVGALIHARVETLVFGAREPRAGSVVSQARLLESGHFNHAVVVEEGICSEQCGALIRNFFQQQRNSQ